MPAATPMARPSLQMPSLHASSDSITPLGPAALAARQLNEAEDQIERWSRALHQLRNRTDETVVRAPPTSQYPMGLHQPNEGAHFGDAHW